MASTDPRPTAHARDAILGGIFVVVGLGLLVTAPRNSPLEGWGMLLSALAGQGLVVAGVDRLARVVVGRRSPTASLAALLGSSVVLFPLAVLALL